MTTPPSSNNRPPADGETPGVALGSLISAVEELASADSAEAVGRIVRSTARWLTGADGVCIVLREGERVRYLDEDAIGPLWKGEVFPIEDCISGWAMTHRQAVVIDDVYADPRIPIAVYTPTFVKSMIVVPVRPDDPIGAICAYWAREAGPSAKALAALETIARVTAVALENVRLNAELRDALERAEAANRAKSDFLATMSHEIRTPLNGVIGAADVLAKTLVTPSQLEMLEIMRESGSDLERILSDILDFSRMQAGGVEIQVRPFHLAELVREVGSNFAKAFHDKGVLLQVAISPSAERMVSGDPVRIRQILHKLVGNALKFTVEGRVDIAVGSGDDGRTFLSVSDTGVGFDPAEKNRIFGGFEQGDASRTRVHGGVGLGLAICRRLADLMDARLEADSKLGEGSVFALTLRLPAANERPANDRLSARKASHADITAPPRAMRVLVVDDHATNRKLIEVLLHQFGAEVATAEDGVDALAAFDTATYDVILMDVKMPVMDGLTATRRIRAAETSRGLPRTPIVMLSASALPADFAASSRAGADRHLTKPIQPAALFEALQETVAERIEAAA
jgi:signal transduction histidine kinase/ActR/RegA family two-component response regulator